MDTRLKDLTDKLNKVDNKVGIGTGTVKVLEDAERELSVYKQGIIADYRSLLDNERDYIETYKKINNEVEMKMLYNMFRVASLEAQKELVIRYQNKVQSLLMSKNNQIELSNQKKLTLSNISDKITDKDAINRIIRVHKLLNDEEKYLKKYLSVIDVADSDSGQVTAIIKLNVVNKTYYISTKGFYASDTKGNIKQVVKYDDSNIGLLTWWFGETGVMDKVLQFVIKDSKLKKEYLNDILAIRNLLYRGFNRKMTVGV